MWGTILAIGLYPAHKWLSRVLGNRSMLAASLLGIGGVGMILGPVTYLTINLVGDIKKLVVVISTGGWTQRSIPAWISEIPTIGSPISDLWESAKTDVGAVLEPLQPQIENIGKFLLGWGANTGLAALQMVIAMIVATAFILNAESLRTRIDLVLRRLIPRQAEQFLQLGTSTLQHVISGVIGVAAVQSGLIGVGLVLARIPWAGILTLACFVLSLLQVGPTLVVVPVLIYSWLTMNKAVALLLTIWLLPVGLIDNVLKPIWMARGLPVPLVVVLLGVIGGTLSNGLIGLFTGPVVLSLAYDLIKLWVKDA